MKKQEVTIDINALDVTQLQNIKDILYSLGKPLDVERVKERIQFYKGILPDSKAKLHFNRFYS